GDGDADDLRSRGTSRSSRGHSSLPKGWIPTFTRVGDVGRHCGLRTSARRVRLPQATVAPDLGSGSERWTIWEPSRARVRTATHWAGDDDRPAGREPCP